MLLCPPAYPAYPAPPAQVPFEKAVDDLRSDDPNVRLLTARMLKEAAYPEVARPLAPLITDSQDDVQLEAIAAELNIFLAEAIVPRRRVGFVLERRTPLAAEAIFSRGPLTLGSRPVPEEVLAALRTAARDDNPRVRLEAVYAFGVLAVEPGGSRRARLLSESGPDLAAMIEAVDPLHRYAAIRVLGRLFARRLQDPPPDERVGDAIISALNDTEDAITAEAMRALGALRYERAVSGLTDLFQYFGKGEMAVAALDAIARIAHPASTPLLTAQLAASDAALRRTAVEGLARIGGREALAPIQEAVGIDRSESLQLARDFASVMLADAPLDPLLESLTRTRVRSQALGYLIEAAPGRSMAFRRHLQDPDPSVRAGVVDALGLSDDPEAVTLIEGMSADSDAGVARAAGRALARLRQARQ